MRPGLCTGVERASLSNDLTRILGVEVKKLERTPGGPIARASGLDYNTTPPCGTVRVYDPKGIPLEIRSFYLFVCQEPIAESRRRYRLTGLVLCDGNLLNADFGYYLSIVGERKKEIGLGTYGDGVNRARPMLIFSNPLGIPQLDHKVTLIHSSDQVDQEHSNLRRVGVITRTAAASRGHDFYCYRVRRDTARGDSLFRLTDPFPSPTRTERTQPRGRFRVDIRPSD